MIYRHTILFTTLLIIGCEALGLAKDDSGSNNTGVNEITEWICITDFNFGKYNLDEILACNDCPDIFPPLENKSPTIYSSIEECEAVCPDESIPVTTRDNPEGTGEYFTMYCTGNE